MANYTKRKNKDGSYTYLIRVFISEDKDGHQVFESMSYHPKATTPKAVEKEVRLVALDFEEKVKNNRYINGSKMTFATFSEYWKSDWAQRNLTQRVYEDYNTALKNVIIPQIGNLKLADIKPLHIQNFINDQEEQGLSPKTVRHRFGVINSVMKYAFRMEMIETNPCVRCELPKVKTDNKLHFFTPEQARRFLNEALTQEYKIEYGKRTRVDSDGNVYDIEGYTSIHHVPYQMQVFLTLAIYGAFRRGELIALTWEDIDFKEGTIRINKAASRIKGAQIIKEPKTTSGNRVVAVPQSCMNMLIDLKKEEIEHSMKLGTAWEGKRGKAFDENYVFITATGGMMNLDTPTQSFKKILNNYNESCEREEDKLPIIRLHDLRHTSATLLLAEGIDIETVSHRLGHSKTSVTLDVYGHALPEVDKLASQKLDEIFNTSDCG